MDERARQAVRQLRIVHLGVCAGIIIFLGIAIGMQSLLPPSELSENVMMGVLLLFAASCGVAWAVVERGAVARVRRIRQEMPQQSDDAVVAAYRQLVIVSAGLIEAPCFLACVSYMLTRSQIAVAATVLGVVLLLSRMPSEERLSQFMEQVRAA